MSAFVYLSETFTRYVFVPVCLIASLENSSFPTVIDFSVLSADGFLIIKVYSFKMQ